MDDSIGIDLGTTNSAGAFAQRGANPQVIPTKEKKRLTPSVVARHHREGTLLVGDYAIRTAQADPVNAIFSIKRLMGRRYSDPEVEKVKRHVSYKIVCPDGARDQAYVTLGEKSYSPIEISALILEKIKSDAEAALGHPVTHAVITVPAYFDDNQREATRQAGCRAGFKVKRIIDEPTAAACAFGLTLDTSTTKTIIVYDLGGGTFDISIISIAEGIPLVDHIEGDCWLGGDRFDNMIMDYVISQVESRNPGIERELRADPEFMWKLKLNSEDAKKALGGSPSTDIVMYGMLKGKIDVDVQLKAADFESWIRKDIEGSIELMEKAMAGPGLTPADIDNVLLVGGSTALPLVRRLLIQKFSEEKIKAYVDPMECVALGAAVLACRTEKKICPVKFCECENEPDAKKCAKGHDIADVEPGVKCPHCGDMHMRDEVVCPKTGKPMIGSTGDKTAKPYGIEVEGGKFEIIVPKSTRYPTAEPIFREFKTVVDAQEQIVIPVYQGFDEVAGKNEKQAEIILPEEGLIPEDKRVPQGTPLDIGFKIDENGTLEIVVKGKGALKWLNFCKLLRPWDVGPVRQPRGDGADTVPPTIACPRCAHQNKRGASVCEQCGEVLSSGGGKGPGGPALPPWKSELTYYVNLSHIAINEYSWTLDATKTQHLRKVMERAQGALDRNDEAAGLMIKPELESAFQQDCGFIQDLVVGTLVYRARIGSLDKNQQLGNLLEEFKQRVQRGEDQSGPTLTNLRGKVNELVQEIISGLGDQNQVECKKCHKKRPPISIDPKCPHCGFKGGVAT